MTFHIIETGKLDCLSFCYCIPEHHILADSFPDILAPSYSEIASGEV